MDTQTRTIRRIILGGAVYDFVVGAPLAIPPLTAFAVNILSGVESALGYKDSFAVLDTVDLIFISMFGFWLAAWGLAKIRMSDLGIVKIDFCMRIGAAAILIWYAVTTEIDGIIYLFIAGELFWGGLDYWGTRALARLGKGGR
jgi:hypothetical protein